MNEVETIQGLINKSQCAKTLRKNAGGASVTALQVLLHEMGFGKDLAREKFVSGTYDDPTGVAVLEFAQAQKPGKKKPDRAAQDFVSDPLAMQILERYKLLGDLKRLAGDVAKEGSAISKSYKKDTVDPGAKGRRDGPITSLHRLLVDYGKNRKPTDKDGSVWRRNFSPDGHYGDVTVSAVSELAGTGTGAALTLPAAKKLIEAVGSRYGPRWRNPGQAPGGKKPVVDKPPVLGKKPVVGKPLHVDNLPVVGENENQGAVSIPTAGAPPVAKRGAPRRDFYVRGGVTACLLGVKPVGQRLENWCWAASTEMMLGYLRSKNEIPCPTCGAGHHEHDIRQGQQMNRRLGDLDVDCRLPRGDDFDYKYCDNGGWPYFYEYEPYLQTTKWAGRRHVLEQRGLQLVDGGPRVRLPYRLTDQQLRDLTYKSEGDFKKRLDDAEGAALSWESLTKLLDDGRPVAFAYRFTRPTVGHMRLAVGYAVTPGNRRWVAICDPMPPDTGDIHLIPYDFYVDGPYGGHWRDFWVPRPEEGSTPPPRSAARELRVGKELVASYITYKKPRKWKVSPDRGRRLDQPELDETLPEARAGLEVVKAIAIEAEPMAVTLGMGCADERAVLDLMELEVPADLDLPDVEPDELVLDEKGRIAVYELFPDALRQFTGKGKDLYLLLDKPREVIYSIRRPNPEGIDFFSALTVRRGDDGWKLSSIGRTDLMSAFMHKQLVSSLLTALERPSSATWARIAMLMGELELEAEELTAEAVVATLRRTKGADREQGGKDRQKTRRTVEAVAEGWRKEGANYSGEIWKERLKRPAGDVLKGWEELAEEWRLWWEALADGRCDDCREALRKEGSRATLLPDYYGGTYNSLEPLENLVTREEEIVRLCSGPAPEKTEEERSVRLFRLIRDQEMAWLLRRFTRPDYRHFSGLYSEKIMEEAHQADRPKYVLNVPELYQLLIAYPEFGTKDGSPDPLPTDEVVPVYRQSFHRPGRQVEQGTLAEVLLDLQQISLGLKAKRERASS